MDRGLGITGVLRCSLPELGMYCHSVAHSVGKGRVLLTDAAKLAAIKPKEANVVVNFVFFRQELTWTMSGCGG